MAVPGSETDPPHGPEDGGVVGASPVVSTPGVASSVTASPDVPKAVVASPAVGSERVSVAEESSLADVRQRKQARVQAARADFWALLGCNAIVFCSSVCIMVLELTASRLIASHLGSSLYSWTSVIGVVLAGISAGNFLGGWLADRYPPQRTLAWLFFAAGVLTLSVLLVNQWAGKMRPPESVAWPVWVIFVVAWIFLPASIALGTISPITANMALKRSLKTGMTVGNIYAWGALGSIAGTFLAGFILIDLFGTRAIVVVTAGTLFALSAAVANGQRALRMFIALGVVPWLAGLGMCVAGTGELTAAAAAVVRNYAVFRADADHRTNVQEARNWGERVGRHFHELGLLFNLRLDQPGDYQDESNYSEISVRRSGNLMGDPRFQVLVLDRLEHSYYDPDDPTQLFYEYEKVYAAVTERVSQGWNRRTSIELQQIPVDKDFAKKLPAGVTFDTERKRLVVEGGMSPAQLRALLSVGTAGKFREALLQAMIDSRKKPGTSSQTVLDALPEGVEFPIELAERVQYSPFLQQIACEKPLRLADALKLMRQGAERGYVEDVWRLFGRSRRVSTMFIGGGGFIFPRWIEERFPDEPLIDVSEIDPAVVTAVEQALGLPPQGQTRIRAHTVDARQFIDRQVRKNAARPAAERVQYDFIYGDAFNHYSVPWHLTTLEFNRQVRQLLTPREGVYLVNVIDIYPRAEYPPRGAMVATGSVLCPGPVPTEVTSSSMSLGQLASAPPPFSALKVRWLGEAGYEVSYQRAMQPEERDALVRLTQFEALRRVSGGNESFVWEDDPTYADFRDAIQQLFSQTRQRLTYSGSIPAALRVEQLKQGVQFDWVPAGEPWPNFESRRWTSEGHVLGYRGRMSTATQAQLRDLAPDDAEYQRAINSLAVQSRTLPGGRFLGRYVQTARRVFPYVYVISSFEDGPSNDRDTLVIACALRKLDFSNLETAGGFWPRGPFAWTEPDEEGHPQDFGQMSAILDRADGQILTDDYAPVDNLLAPLFQASD